MLTPSRHQTWLEVEGERERIRIEYEQLKAEGEVGDLPIQCGHVLMMLKSWNHVQGRKR
jgi:hypothetical protein